jgi:oxygen-independent coproporphyrinogen-3 oxidase
VTSPGDGPGFGVYVHVPFCASRCDYCDFATWTDRAHLVHDYVDACVADVQRRAPHVPPATSVFFGGGTPSFLPADELARVLAAVPRTEGAEVTVECNPDSVDAEKLAVYRAAGVTRLSFGVQSMRTHVLAALGRTHDPANVTRAIASARSAGFESFNVDVIFGAPGETVDDWRATLDAVVALDPPHVSAYALTVEPATPLGRRVAAGGAGPDDDDQATKYEVTDEVLTGAGLGWYEISNWARPGHECRHNLLYWAQGEYLGIGCAAHGHTASGAGAARRWWNVRTPERYVDHIGRGSSPEAGEERLDADTRAEEALTLALRTRTGARFGPAARDTVDELCGYGLLEADAAGAGRAVLTRRGRLLAGDVTARLLAAAGSGGRTRSAAGYQPLPSGTLAARGRQPSDSWHSVHSSASGPAPPDRDSRTPPTGDCSSGPSVPIHLEPTGPTRVSS